MPDAYFGPTTMLKVDRSFHYVILSDRRERRIRLMGVGFFVAALLRMTSQPFAYPVSQSPMRQLVKGCSFDRLTLSLSNHERGERF